MNYNESDATLRQIPIYLEDSGGSPVTGLTLTGAELKVSLSGAAFVDGGGTATEVGSGYYYYTATQAETLTDSFITLRVNDAAAKVYVISVDIGERIQQNEPAASARRLPIYMVDTSGTPVTGLTLDDTRAQVSVAGGAFADIVNTPATEVGLGLYYYELDLTEVATSGVGILKVVHPSAVPYIYAWDVVPEVVLDDGECGYFGGYFGLCLAEAASTTGPSPVESPLELNDPEYLDLAAQAISRLCEYAKRKAP